MAEILLSIRDLRTYFYTYAGVVKALDGISLDVYRRETLGLVGETGCGKSVTALSILQLIPNPPGRIVSGEILFDGKDLLKVGDDEMKRIRGKKISMVFQDPMTYLNPVMTVRDQISEVVQLHQDLRREGLLAQIDDLKEKVKLLEPNSPTARSLNERVKGLEAWLPNPPYLSQKDTKRAALRKTLEVLRMVRMPYPEKVVSQYPHELSGGMRQRVMIAMALSCNPSLFIADEATTSLDVTIQAQILHLLNELKRQLDASLLIITHDLGIVAETCDRVAVMYAGVIVEIAETRSLFKNPLHPYTRGLMNAIPTITEEKERLEVIKGSVPNLINPPTGCRFHPRCPFRMPICDKERPPLLEVEPGHHVACYLYPEGGTKKD